MLNFGGVDVGIKPIKLYGSKRLIHVDKWLVLHGRGSGDLTFFIFFGGGREG